MSLINKQTVVIDSTSVDNTAALSTVSNNSTAAVPKISTSSSTKLQSIDANSNITVVSSNVIQNTSTSKIKVAMTPSLSSNIHLSEGVDAVSHRALTDLDYAHSGHTGFASEEALRGKQDKLVAGPTLVINDNIIDSRFSLTDVIIDF